MSMSQSDDVKKLVIQSTASIDQYWENFEVLYPFICKLSRGIPLEMDMETRELARSCCQLVAWDLALRVLKKNRSVKCTINYEEQDLISVDITTSEGMQNFLIEKSNMIGDEDGIRVAAPSYRMVDGFYQVHLPVMGGNENIVVPASEIVDGEVIE